MKKLKPQPAVDIQRWVSEAHRTLKAYYRIVDVGSTYPHDKLLLELMVSLLHFANSLGLPVEEIWKKSFRLFKLGLGEEWPKK